LNLNMIQQDMRTRAERPEGDCGEEEGFGGDTSWVRATKGHLRPSPVRHLVVGAIGEPAVDEIEALWVLCLPAMVVSFEIASAILPPQRVGHQPVVCTGVASHVAPSMAFHRWPLG
jgi:hypothetical protein